MKKNKKKLKVAFIIFSAMIFLILTVPMLIPVEGRVGLKEPEDMVTDGSAIVTIPFKGTDGIDIYYEYEKDDNNEKNFILLHGSMYNSKSWSEVMEFFAEKGNVYAYDQIPYGYSEKILEGEWTGENPYTTNAAVEELEIFMNELGIEKATLVGSSFGGVLAAEAAIRYADRVESLILVSPAIFASESLPEWLVTLPQIEQVGPLLAAGLSESDSFYESTFYDKEAISVERMGYNKRETQINNWNLAMWEYLQSWSVYPSNVGEKLADISQPTIVISGDSDKVVPLEDSRKVAELIRDAEFVVIPECGHMPHEERPKEFLLWISKWIDSTGGVN